jgi:hypothetical protein
MTVVVHPERFTLVNFDADRIAAVVTRLLADIGLPDDVEVTIDVDERIPLGQARIASVEPIVIEVEGGALEDPKHPRALSEAGTADVLGRLLLRIRDRLDPAFGDPPADDELSLPERSAWNAYCAARLARAGYRAQKQRRLYAFRNRHGFTDAADAAFERLWSADGLRWADIVALSQEALAAGSGVPAP